MCKSNNQNMIFWLFWRKNESISLKITCISFVCLWYCPLETTLVNYYGHALSENITDPTIISPAQWVQIDSEKVFLFSFNFTKFLLSFRVVFFIFQSQPSQWAEINLWSRIVLHTYFERFLKTSWKWRVARNKIATSEIIYTYCTSLHIFLTTQNEHSEPIVFSEVCTMYILHLGVSRNFRSQWRQNGFYLEGGASNLRLG